MNYRPPAILFVVLLAAAGFFIIGTTGALPARVASHFDASGFANGYMTRDGYRLFMLAFGVGFPLLIVALISRLPRLVPNRVNIPHRTYWFEPERRAATLAALSTYALWLGCLLAVMISGVHWLVLRSNALDPLRLENGLFLALLAVFFAAVAARIVMLLRRFRKIL